MAGCIYVVSMGRWLLPRRDTLMASVTSDPREYVVSVKVDTRYAHLGECMGELWVTRCIPETWCMWTVGGHAVRAPGWVGQSTLALWLNGALGTVVGACGCKLRLG